jgi:hypothetical protein
VAEGTREAGRRASSRQRLQSPDFEFLPELPLTPNPKVLAVEGPQCGERQRDGAGRIVPLVPQEEEVIAYPRFIERRRVAAKVPTDQYDIAEVSFACPWSQIAQLDKAAKLVYGCIVRMSSR